MYRDSENNYIYNSKTWRILLLIYIKLAMEQKREQKLFTRNQKKQCIFFNSAATNVKQKPKFDLKENQTKLY